MATGTVRIILVAVGLALGAFVMAKAFPSDVVAVSSPDTSPTDDGATGDPGEAGDPGTEGGQGGGGTEGGEQAAGMDVSILVQNGTEETGLAEEIAGFISGLGYTNVDFGDADSSFSETTIYYQPDVREEAQALREAVYKRATMSRATADSDYQINVVLGADYVG